MLYRPGVILIIMSASKTNPCLFSLQCLDTIILAERTNFTKRQTSQPPCVFLLSISLLRLPAPPPPRLWACHVLRPRLVLRAIVRLPPLLLILLSSGV